MQLPACPVCRGGPFTVSRPVGAIRKEIRLRRDFVLFRLGRKASRGELKDLTEFMHGSPAALASCSGCGVLLRAEPRIAGAGSYEEDRNDPDLMTQLFPRYLGAFRHKEPAYRELLSPHAEVLELGSHLGAFLQAGEEWDWQPVGLDVGADTTQFARHRGFRVYRRIVEDSAFPDRSFEAVFVWNCFEQIPDPASTLMAAHHALRRHGLLVIRVPNAFFYRVIGRRLRGADEDGFIVRALGYNNLLGFPYLYGYTAASLNRLAWRWGFEYVRGFNSELVTMPFPDVTKRISREQSEISEAVGCWSSSSTMEAGLFTGPWIEMVYRKVEEDAWNARRARGPRTLISMPKSKIDLRFLERAA
jgi:SAM-dependent methyltransferase